jgi:hypothetical protein
MSHEQRQPQAALRLPIQITHAADIARIGRELQDVEEFLQQSKVRQPGTAMQQRPNIGRKLEVLCETNNLNLLQSEDRARLAGFLKEIEHAAPHFHVSFATEAPQQIVRQITEWLRTNIHPWSLVTIGLSPAIVAGCVIRSTNQVFDMSLQHRFAESSHILSEAIKALSNQPTHG